MPKFDPSTPTRSLKFAEVQVNVPQPYAEGQVLTALDAKFVNRQLSTVTGNAFGGWIRRARETLDTERAAALKAKSYDGPMDASGKKPAPATTADVLTDAQAKFDEIFTAYEVGASNRGSGEGAPSADPLVRETNRIGADEVKKLISGSGLKITDFMRAKARDEAKFTSRFTELVSEYVASNSWVHDLAAQNLTQQEAARSSASSIDLGSLDLPAPGEGAQAPA